MTKDELKQQIENLFQETKLDMGLDWDKTEITERDLDDLRDKVLGIVDQLDR